MRDDSTQAATSRAAQPVPLRDRMVERVQGIWRPTGTAVAIVLILLFGWGVVNGKHGLSAWQQQRVKDKQLNTEIQRLQQENSGLRDHVDRLKSDPDAIEHEARQQLHYAKPGEVIYTLPAEPESQPATTAR